jgi:type IV secretion system protein VirB11
METVAEQQHQRLKAKLERELGPVMLSALADPNVIEIMRNPDGWIWTDAHGTGLTCTGQYMAAMQAENLLGTIAAILGTVITPDVPILEGELPFSLHRFAGMLPPVVPSPTLAIRKHAPVIYPLTDYLDAWQISVLQDAIRARKNMVVAGGTS